MSSHDSMDTRTMGGACTECGAYLGNHEAVALHLSWHIKQNIEIREALSQAMRANRFNQVIG